MITAIIIDDEQNSSLTLKALLEEYCPGVHIVGIANNAKSGKELILSAKPQLVFLDIEMPLGSGFDMLKSLSVINFEIIFVTAYNQYAIKAFRFSALDYLVKPVRITQLAEAVNKAVKRIKEKRSTQEYELLISNMMEQKPSKQKISFTERGQQYFVTMEDIMYILADGNYCHVYSGVKTFLSSKSLKDFENILPQDMFCRIHNGHIVNINFIDKLHKGRVAVVTMKDGKELEIAVRRKDDFMKMYVPA